MSPSRKQIMEFVRENPGCTSADIAEAYGCTVSNISCKTSRLYSQGYIMREPEDLRQAPRGMCYRLWSCTSMAESTEGEGIL